MNEGDSKAVSDFVGAVSAYPGVVAQVYAVAPPEWKRLVELAEKVSGGNKFPPEKTAN